MIRFTTITKIKPSNEKSSYLDEDLAPIKYIPKSLVALAAVHSKSMVLLLFIHFMLLLPLFAGLLCLFSLLCDAVLGVLSSFAIISLRKGELVA